MKQLTTHYDDVIMSAIASQITSLTIVYPIVYSDADQRKIKAPRHWPLCGEFTGNGEFPAQRASYAENVSIWWRHHDIRCNRRRADRTVFYIVVCRTLEHVSLYQKYKLPDLCTHRYIHGNIFYTRTTPSFKLILVVSLFDLKCIWNIGMSGHMQAYIAMPRQRFLSWKWEYN